MHLYNMSQVEVEQEQPIQSEGLRLEKLVPQNSEELESLIEDVDPVQEANDVTVHVQPISKSTNMEFPIFMFTISMIQVDVFYMGGQFSCLYLGYDPSRRHEVWKFLTNMFVHSSGSHLWGNLIGQLLYGVPLEIFYHWKRVAIIYMGGVLGGTLFSSIFITEAYAGGASTRVYVLNFALVSTILLNWNHIGNKCCVLFSVILACMFYDDGLSVNRDLVAESVSNVKINHAGHFGGAVTGFLISILVLKNVDERSWRKKLQKISASILITLTLITVLTNIACPSLYPQPEFNKDYEVSFVLKYFKMIDNSSQPSHHFLVMKCLELKECAEAWVEYKNTGKVTYK